MDDEFADYPTDEDLQAIRDFVGTPEEMTEFLRDIWHWDMVSVAEARDQFNEDVVRVRLVTGGWSGNEEIISTLQSTMYWFIGWQESHRGGLHILEFRPDQWNGWVNMGVPKL